MRIRTVLEGELPLLQEIEVAAGQRFAQVGLGAVSQDDPISLETLQDSLESGILIGAEFESAGLVGFAAVVDLDGAPHLEEISVLPSYGQRGIGSALIRHLAAALERAGQRALTLSTFREIPWNAPFYSRLGFRPLAEQGWSPALRSVRAREAASGLEVSERVIMRLDLPSR